jgi:hypothetical protein
MFEKSVEEIVGKLNAHRPGPLHSSGMTVALHDFLIDLTNIISFSPARMRGDIYLDIYGHKASADKWDAKAYASVVLSDRHTHCFIESTKTLQGKSIALPDCIHHTVSALANLEPFSTR